jgi:hypothetical protein
MDKYSLDDLIDFGCSNLMLKIAEENDIDLASYIPLNIDGSLKSSISKDLIQSLKSWLLSLQ